MLEVLWDLMSQRVTSDAKGPVPKATRQDTADSEGELFGTQR